MPIPRCKCGSYAINPREHGRDGSDGELCDVCYWRTRAESALEKIKKIKDIIKEYEKSQSGQYPEHPIQSFKYIRGIIKGKKK